MQYQIVQVLADCNTLLPWKRSRDDNMRDIVLLIFEVLEDGSGSNVSSTSRTALENTYVQVIQSNGNGGLK